MIVVPKAARATLADWLWLEEVSGNHNLQIGLFKNDYTPDVLTAFGDLVVATFTGYAAVDFTRSDNGASILSGNIARTKFFNQLLQWHCNGAPHTVYGWWLKSTDLNQLLLVERYTTPHVLQVGSVHTLDAQASLGKFLAD